MQAAPIACQSDGYDRRFGLVLDSRQAGSVAGSPAAVVAGSKKEHGSNPGLALDDESIGHAG